MGLVSHLFILGGFVPESDIGDVYALLKPLFLCFLSTVKTKWYFILTRHWF